ncbi:hypothetical protein HO173_001139 [Letharia columbiana]|uniref:Uncharacterized protein n=1 Tax=Letharia columbiana TaxID=112416 RepID=A0A8H6L9H5_9LECA|nr:uncharacterized protein HO173_001139 [Letharia columbiana]KAF6240471.1 hypothetical protein HO173_001139 [Letharia columbiana]
MSRGHPEAKAACRDRLYSPRVGFRAGLVKVFQRYVERIFCSQTRSTSSIHARPTSSRSKKQSRPVSLIEEENHVARQIRDIYSSRLRAPPTPPRGRFLAQAVRSERLRQEYTLTLPLPSGRASLAGDIRHATSTIDLTRFLAGLPGIAAPTIKKTNPEDLVGRMFPPWATSCGARHVAACFWSWLCVLDDLTENKDTRIALENIVSILSRSPYDPLPSSPLAVSLMGAFHSAVQTASITNQNPLDPVDPIREPWKEVFWSEVATVARALLAEQDLDDQKFTMQEWLDLRVLTISARPLLVLLQASFGLPASSGPLVIGPLKNLPLILGLQNDILGFDKDFSSGNPLSAVQLLIRDGMDKKNALLRIVGLHNRLVMEMTVDAEDFDGTDQERDFVTAASRWPNAMALWMVSCERYK